MTTSAAPWRALILKALHINRAKPEAKYLQIATVDDKARPSVRTVVFRGWHDNNSLLIHSDTRSEKNAHLGTTPHASVCWYFPLSREQFRLMTTARIVSQAADELAALREQQWRQLSAASKAQYNSGTPGTALHEHGSPAALPDDGMGKPAKHFSVIVLSPNHLDYLNLKHRPQRREQYHPDSDGTWHNTAVFP